MHPREWEKQEQNALMAAGDRGGAYLDRIGKTDLATLDRDQWTKFLQEIVEGFGSDLEKRLTRPLVAAS
jgi:hypothetical protein